MNLDNVLLSAMFDEEEHRTQFVRTAQEKYQRRKALILPGGKVVFQCIARRGVYLCEKAIASTEIHDGQARFKIMLLGAEARPRKAKVLIERQHKSSFIRNVEFVPKAEWEEADRADKMFQEQADRAENEQSWSWEDIVANLGGKCFQCGTVHGFTYEEIAQVLGFADCETALRTKLRKGDSLHTDPKQLVAGFLAIFVHRTDGRWQAPGKIHERAFVKVTSVWEKVWEYDPFAEE